MKITDLNLLEIDVISGNDTIYTGMCEDAPEELKQKSIKVIGMDGKKLKLKLE